MTKRINYFKLHINDFIEGTFDLTTEEIGAYLLLTLRHYQVGEIGLEDNDKALAYIAKVSPQKWRTIKHNVLSKFDKVEGRWVGRRVCTELLAIKAHSEQQRLNALKKHKTDVAIAKPSLQNGSANHKPLTNKINKEEINKSNPDAFLGHAITLKMEEYEKLHINVCPHLTDQHYMDELDKCDDWIANKNIEGYMKQRQILIGWLEKANTSMEEKIEKERWMV